MVSLRGDFAYGADPPCRWQTGLRADQMLRRSQTMPGAALQPLARDDVTAQPWSSRQLAVLLLIVLCGTALRLFHVQLWSFGDDEVRTWQGITAAAGGPMGVLSGEQGHHPLVLMGLRWLLDTGLLPFHGEGWLRLPFVFAGVTTVPLLALTGRQLVGDNRVALVAAALLAVHPWHVALSQTAAPRVFMLLFALGALGAALAKGGRRAWWRHVVCALGAVLAIGSDAGGWLLLPMLAAGWLARSWPLVRGRVAIGYAVVWLGVPLLPALGLQWSAGSLGSGGAPSSDVLAALLEVVRWPVVILASAALFVWRPVPLLHALVLASPLVSVSLADWAGVPIAIDALVIVLPVLLLLAAQTCWRCFDLVRAGVATEGRGAALAAALVPVALSLSLLVDSCLHVTAYEGQRPPWRLASRLATDASEPHGVLVGTASGWSSLVFYLRRNHWRGLVADPHPGTWVEALDLTDPAAALTLLLAGANGKAVMLVLLRSELASIDADPAAKALLSNSFRPVEVLATAFRAGQASLFVFRAIDSAR